MDQPGRVVDSVSCSPGQAAAASELGTRVQASLLLVLTESSQVSKGHVDVLCTTADSALIPSRKAAAASEPRT